MSPFKFGEKSKNGPPRKKREEMEINYDFGY